MLINHSCDEKNKSVDPPGFLAYWGSTDFFGIIDIVRKMFSAYFFILNLEIRSADDFICYSLFCLTTKQ
mgnify:CR=1 FL=1